MGVESENKAERILSIYTQLIQGKIVRKNAESIKFGVSPRTIQRDISDVQNYFQNQNSETGEMKEIVFDRKQNGYRLETKIKTQLSEKEILAVCKILLESRALVKEEMFPIISKLTENIYDDEEKKAINLLIGNEKYHYIELRHGQRLLERLWKLEEAVKNNLFVRIQYQKMKNGEVVERKVKPVGIMFSEFYFYMTAYIEEIDKEKEFKNPDDPFPTIYRVDRLQDIEVLEEHFSIPYAERFEEGEFRKRIQFMYGGRLRKIKFKYKGNSLDSILDRLPTAEITGKEKDGVIIKAEVFGDGIDMWIRSQGDTIEILK